eukprot:1685905-Pyramimonas_sp.AAC.1
MFGHHICNLFFCTYIPKPNMFKLACLTYPIQVNTMSTMKVTKCGCTSLLDNLDHGPVVLEGDEMHFGRAALLSGLWIHA